MSLETFFSTEIIVPVIVAFIGFLVAVTTAVIAKEQKVSEFRQVWINSLREHCASLIVSFHKCRHLNLDARKLNTSQSKDELSFTAQYNAASFELLTSIQLVKFYLNAKEHNKIINDMRSLSTLIQDIRSKKVSGDELEILDNEIHHKIHELSDSIPDLLKTEWERVKKGEKRYILFVSVGEFIGAIITVTYFVLLFLNKFPEYFPGIN